MSRIAWLLAVFLCTTASMADVDADYSYTTNNGSITITKYIGSDDVVAIPDKINDLPVTTIGDQAFKSYTSLTSLIIPDSVTCIGIEAFYSCRNLTGVTIGNSVTNMGDRAFLSCGGLTNITIPDSVISIGNQAFQYCDRLASIAIPDSVTSVGGEVFYSCTGLIDIMIGNGLSSIGESAFYSCSHLTSITIGSNVTSIGDYALSDCPRLTAIYCKGNAPAIGESVFEGADNVTVYYLSGTTYWDSTFGDRPTALWRPQVIGDGSFGLLTNQFGFNINWINASGMDVVVEASTNLNDSVWTPLITNTLTGDSVYFSDPDWINFPERYYRVISP